MNFDKKFAFAASALLLTSMPALAQVESASSAAALRGFAAPALQSPVALGASWGAVGFGIYGQTIDSTDGDVDGAAGIAFGLGNADKYAGLEVSLGSSSLFGDQGSNADFGEVGGVGLKLHTNLPGYASFAVGVNGVGRWGGDKNPNRSSVYAAASKFFDLGPVSTIVTVGIGDNAYNEPNEEGAGIFGSAALYFTHQISLIAEHTGRFTNAAVSVAPFKSYPLTITLGAVNLGERYGADTEFAGTIGYGFSFK